MIPRRGEAANTHHVSSLLHTLRLDPSLVCLEYSSISMHRGEEFRRRRNLTGAHAHAPASLSTQGPSLPPIFSSESDYEGPLHEPQPTPPLPGTKVAGPAAPRSWIPSRPPTTLSATPEWRRRALSLVLKHLPSHSPALAQSRNPRVPSLFQMCLHNLLFKWGGIPPEIFAELPRHILREYVRYSAVHAPSLPREDLEALWGVDDAGSADGELVVYGPSVGSLLPRFSGSPTTILSEWDSAADTIGPEPPPVLHTLIVLSSTFSPSLVFLFPPTLTHLALLAVPAISLHKLPAQLPLITFLDLSFNPWVGGSAGKIARVEWHKWMNLEVLGMRECGMSEEDTKTLREKVNRGRLTDVEIVTF
jgi:hypothetical protein